MPAIAWASVSGGVAEAGEKLTGTEGRRPVAVVVAQCEAEGDGTCGTVGRLEVMPGRFQGPV